MNAPCKDCENRTLGCHSTCEKYKEYDTRNIERREEHSKEKRLNELQRERADNWEKYRKAAWQRNHNKNKGGKR